MTTKWLELTVFALIVGAVCWAAHQTTETVLETAIVAESAGQATGADITVDDVRSRSGRAILVYVLGMAALGTARYCSLRRGRRNLPAFLILPAVACATGLGLVSQMGHGNPLLAGSWRGPGFAFGVGLGGLLAALLLAGPKDPMQVIRRFRAPLAVFVVSGGVLLWLFGSGPAGSDSQINLSLGSFSVQPIEAIKLAFVCLLGLILGEKAVQLRFQRDRAWLLHFPRPRLMATACVVLVVLFAALALLVKDLGPTLVLSLVFLLLFYISTRSTGWLVVAVTVLASGLLIVSRDPSITGSQTVATRFAMWLDPWMNGLPHGSQLAASLWAIAAGGFWGQGVGQADVAALPASHTDLMIAHLAETTGVWGGLLYLICLGACTLQGLSIAARNREPERVLIGAACSLLVLSQWGVIFSGTTGLLPLTGLAVPFLSWGKSSMIAFMLAIALLLRLAEDGAPRSTTTELKELQATVTRVAVAGAAALLVAGCYLIHLGVIRGPATSARAVLETLRDGTTRMRHDPRLDDVLARIRRGEILDRHGNVIAGTQPGGERSYPLSDSLGALLCPPDPGLVLRREWCLERIHEQTLRGYPERSVRPAVWRARAAGSAERTLFAVESGRETVADRRRAGRLAEGSPVRFVPLPAPDLSSMARLVRSRRYSSRVRLESLVDDVSARSVRLTLDARLQLETVRILREHSREGAAAASVVIDVDTGEVLARAQVPDVDLSREDWYRHVIDGDPEFTGVYGPWADKTGMMGFRQAGSIAKVFTALAAIRNGVEIVGEGCGARTTRSFDCSERDEIGSLFSYPGWDRPIHDHPEDRSHGAVDLAGALARSCNVAFSELTVETGPEALRSLASDGVEIGWQQEFDPGPAGSRRLASTGIGQGAAILNVSQAARLVAAIGAGGVYRRCPSSLLLGAACEERMLVDDGRQVEVILAGMHLAMKSGTGAGLPGVPGVRLYGKTGTADSEANRDEEPYGYSAESSRLPPHSWFLALAEPADGAPCGSQKPGRIAVATLIPRGGGGTRAGAATVRIIAAARALGYLKGGS